MHLLAALHLVLGTRMTLPDPGKDYSSRSSFGAWTSARGRSKSNRGHRTWHAGSNRRTRITALQYQMWQRLSSIQMTTQFPARLQKPWKLRWEQSRTYSMLYTSYFMLDYMFITALHSFLVFHVLFPAPCQYMASSSVSIPCNTLILPNDWDKCPTLGSTTTSYIPTILAKACCANPRISIDESSDQIFSHGRLLDNNQTH